MRTAAVLIVFLSMLSASVFLVTTGHPWFGLLFALAAMSVDIPKDGAE